AALEVAPDALDRSRARRRVRQEGADGVALDAQLFAEQGPGLQREWAEIEDAVDEDDALVRRRPRVVVDPGAVDRVEDDARPGAAGDLLHARDVVLAPRVNDGVGGEAPERLDLLGGRGGGDRLRAERVCELDGGDPDGARGGGNDDEIPGA